MSIEILVLLVLFQIKHLVADYYLQFPYMYMNKGQETGWVKPLVDHAGVHALFTMVIVALFMFNVNPEMSTRSAFAIIGSTMLFDFVTHFATDRWKAKKKDGPDTSAFWYSLGIDQMVHHTVGVLIVFWITQV